MLNTANETCIGLQEDEAGRKHTNARLGMLLSLNAA